MSPNLAVSLIYRDNFVVIGYHIMSRKFIDIYLFGTFSHGTDLIEFGRVILKLWIDVCRQVLHYFSIIWLND
jgi:hypothetical protein